MVVGHTEFRTQQLGRELFARARSHEHHALSGWFQQHAMNWGMRDERVKAQLFRFVDVLPALATPQQVLSHFSEYLGTVKERLPAAAGTAMDHLPRSGWMGRGAAGAVRLGARQMARQFIAATDLPEAIASAERLRSRNLGFTIDMLGEAVLSETEAAKYEGAYLNLIQGLATAAIRWPRVALIDEDDRGNAIPTVNVSVKLSSLYSQFDPIAPDLTGTAVRQRLRPILRLARAHGVFINIDMEQFSYKDLTIRIFREVLDEPEFRDWADVGIAIQAYLRSSGDDLEQLANWARSRGTPVWVRLVKGAYWDYETVIAQQNDWPIPVYSLKCETDANYERQTEFLMRNRDVLRPAIASHNVRSIAHALALSKSLGLPPRSFEFQMLYGMADPVKSALTSMGHRVRVYTPFGELLPGMAYLVRRLLENTSNESFLRAGFLEHVPEERLLMNPLTALAGRRDKVSHASTNGSPGASGPVVTAFRNEPLSDFSTESARASMQAALKQVSQSLGKTYPLIIDGRRIDPGTTIDSVDPSQTSRLVGKVAAADVQHANTAVAAAKAAFPAWRDTSPENRAAMLRRAAQIFRERRFELAAWEVYETAKPWREADADVAEAIDYCEFYAREMVRLSKPQHRDVPGEDNRTFYEPRGVAVAIAPWNFPLAILCGMTAAALVTGNPCIIKPAEQSAVIGAKLMEVLQQAGFPPGVIHFLPGDGAVVGPALINHPDVATIAFTGSRAVGLQIQADASRTPPGQDHVKHVITEMGGKNAVIVDDDADLDEAVHGVVASAFGYAGQKCSACSRVILLERIYDAFLDRLVETTRSLKIGPAEDPATTVCAVIDAEARDRIRDTIEKAKSTTRLAYAGTLDGLETRGTYVAPHIFADVAPSSSLASEEIFGPVLAVLKACDLDDALTIANSTQYALTGGIFTRSPAHAERARREFRVGNLYINRKITGAFVDRQPFGGFKLSGTGNKAGGADYLQHFLLTRTITENTLRRGFAASTSADPDVRSTQAAT